MYSWHLAQCHLEEVNDLRSIGQSSVIENSSLNPWVLDPTREVNFGLAQVNIGQVSSVKQWYPKQGSNQNELTVASFQQRLIERNGNNPEAVSGNPELPGFILRMTKIW